MAELSAQLSGTMEQVKNAVRNMTLSDGAYKGPGRLGHPDMDVQSDPRTNPDLVKVLQAIQAGGYQGGKYPDLNDEAAVEAVVREAYKGNAVLYASVPLDLPEDSKEPEVEEKEISIEGSDGNKIKLWVYRAKNTSAEILLPAVCYFHGGGMTVNDTYSRPHVRWAKSLAVLGMVAILVDFRNAFQADGKHHPFPAGLNDCAAAARYVYAHRSDLGVSKIIVQGESGGGNLALATALKAKKEGFVEAIDGVYSTIPYISGGYGWSDERKLKELPSLAENDGYLLSNPMMAAMAHFYSPKEGEMENPLAWPYYATADDLKGLPPHFLSMDELDPLRDEGMAYTRMLWAAGVKTTAEVNLGVTHGTSLFFRQALPEVHLKAVRQVVAFAKSL